MRKACGWCLLLGLTFVAAAEEPTPKPPPVAKVDADKFAGFGMSAGLAAPGSRYAYQGSLVPSHGEARQVENGILLAPTLARDNVSSWTASFKFAKVELARDLTLSSGAPVSSDWSNDEIGATYARQRSGGKNWSVKAAFGYAGDGAPYGSLSDSVFNAIGTYGFPGNNSDYWVLMAFVANNSQIANGIPIPGFMYIRYRPTFAGMFGFPVNSVSWRFHPGWELSASLVAFDLSSEATYAVNSELRAFLAYSNKQQIFLPKDRQFSRDRLYLHEQKLGPGVRWLAARSVMLESQIGLSFDRSLYVGPSIFDPSRGSRHLESAGYVALGLIYKP